ncbi:beta-defensin 114 [Felis catus]|uniref:beta-defensin 114 n=1 Tax=Felis catus TaxID=9685 RepID=UPI001D19C534|nr:beta-defensin 114 [Felis catus]
MAVVLATRNRREHSQPEKDIYETPTAIIILMVKDGIECISSKIKDKISNFSYSSFTVATCTLVDPNRCSQNFGYCRRCCFKYEKQIDICLSPSKICCIERLFEED